MADPWNHEPFLKLFSLFLYLGSEQLNGQTESSFYKHFFSQVVPTAQASTLKQLIVACKCLFDFSFSFREFVFC